MFHKIHHIGIATDNLESMIKDYTEKFGFKLHAREKLEHLGLELVFLKLEDEDTFIELLSSLRPDTSIQKFLEKNGGGIHHICYEVKDIRQELKKLDILGFNLIDKEPRIGAENALIAFIHPKSAGGVLIELLEKR